MVVCTTRTADCYKQPPAICDSAVMLNAVGPSRTRLASTSHKIRMQRLATILQLTISVLLPRPRVGSSRIYLYVFSGLTFWLFLSFVYFLWHVPVKSSATMRTAADYTNLATLGSWAPSSKACV